MLRAPQVALLVGTLVVGLLADVHAGMALQLLIGAAFWIVLVHVLRRVAPAERRAAIACLVVATAGEALLSLAWGVYRYRLGNIPLFVPPGHVMMYLLGAGLALRMSERLASGVAAGTVLYAAGAAVSGLDSFSTPLLLALGVPWILLPRERRLLAATFVLALLLELYGTALGTWTWGRHVPGTVLVTTNPPVLAGALYCFRDALVPVAVVLLARAESLRSAPTPPGLQDAAD